MEEQLVLVDQNDVEVGTGEKIPVHEQGTLHRAFSVFVFNGAGRLLLQRRLVTKYHSGGLWTNTCCGHPRPGEPIGEAARRRLHEEMGFDCALSPAFSFIYKAELDHGLTEHEYDHVFVGEFEGDPRPNPDEVDDWRWAGVDEVSDDVAASPGRYSVWFRIAWAELRARGMPEQVKNNGGWR